VSKRLLALSIGLTAIVAAALAAQELPALIARRLPFGAPVVGVPLTPSSLQRALAEVAWAARIPIGYEAPEDELWEPAPSSRTMNVEGQTVEQVLDAIVALQPHYGWSEDDGVIHLRPKTALADPNNVLNRRVEMFVLDETTLQLALREVHFSLRPELRQGGITGSGGGPTALGLMRFTVRVGQTTVQGVLDAIVKAHGASSWSVTYTPDSGAARPYKISFHTFDGWGTTW
jgi:hypothetical protein